MDQSGAQSLPARPGRIPPALHGSGRHLILTGAARLPEIKGARESVIFTQAPAPLPAGRGDAACVRGVWRGMDLPFAAAAFDLVFVNAPFRGLWQQDELADFFAQLWRISAAEGHVLLRCDCSLWRNHYQKGHSHFTPPLLRRALAQAGFSSIKTEKPEGSFLWRAALRQKSRQFHARKRLLRTARRAPVRALSLRPA